MPAFMTAAATRVLYDRAQRAHPRRVDPELNTAFIDLADEGITAANEYAEGMIGQSEFELAAWGYMLKAEFAEQRAEFEAIRDRLESEEGDDGE